MTEDETKQVSAKKPGLCLLHLMNHKIIFRKNGINLEFHFRGLNLVGERCST